VARDGIEPPTP